MCDDVKDQLAKSEEVEELCQAITGKTSTTRAGIDHMMRHLTAKHIKNGKKSAGKGVEGIKLKKEQILHCVAARTHPDVSKMPKGFFTKTKLTNPDPNAADQPRSKRSDHGDDAAGCGGKSDAGHPSP